MSCVLSNNYLGFIVQFVFFISDGKNKSSQGEEG
jgi:hypothetical protein